MKKLPIDPRTGFPIVSTKEELEQCTVGQIYTTYNYKLFKYLKYNRGKKEGYVTERVTKIKNMIKNGEFMFRVCHVTLNLEHKVIDGNNRNRGLSEMNEPINFEITAEPKFNRPNSDSEILNNVSDYNAINSSWSDKDAFLSALQFKEPTAIAIDNLKSKLDAENGFRSNLFSPSRLIILAKKQANKLGSTKQSRRAYCCEKTAKTLESDQFQKLLHFLTEVFIFTRENNKSINLWFMARGFLPMIWDKELSYNVVLKNLKKRGFADYDDIYTTKMEGVERFCLDVLRMGNV